VACSKKQLLEVISSVNSLWTSRVTGADKVHYKCSSSQDQLPPSCNAGVADHGASMLIRGGAINIKDDSESDGSFAFESVGKAMSDNGSDCSALEPGDCDPAAFPAPSAYDAGRADCLGRCVPEGNYAPRLGVHGHPAGLSPCYATTYQTMSWSSTAAASAACGINAGEAVDLSLTAPGWLQGRGCAVELEAFGRSQSF
jgi:hypothetical protein